MKSKILIAFLVVLVIVAGLILGFLSLYQYSGLKHYIKAGKYINEIQSVEERAKAWDSFIGKTENKYGGIYAGSFLNREWVWGRVGLRPFKTDQYSVYTFFERCEEAYLAAYENGDSPKSYKVILENIENWKQKVSVGDYVVVFIAQNGNKGNLREIYTYNSWPFIQKDPRTQCTR